METIQTEIAEVNRRLDRFWDFLEMVGDLMNDITSRVEAHKERKERFDASAAKTESILSQREPLRDDKETI